MKLWTIHWNSDQSESEELVRQTLDMLKLMEESIKWEEVPLRTIIRHGEILFRYRRRLLGLTLSEIRARERASAKTPPPRNAKFTLLLFLSKEDREVQLGDLEETYHKIAEEFGSRRANFWYRSQVVRSLGPWIWTLIKRGGIASGGLFSLSKVTEFFGRLLGG